MLQITGAGVDVLIETVANSFGKIILILKLLRPRVGLNGRYNNHSCSTRYFLFWWNCDSYSFGTDVSGSAGANTKIGFARSSISNAHYVYFNSTSQIQVVLEDNSTIQIQKHSHYYEPNVWNHYVVSIQTLT